MAQPDRSQSAPRRLAPTGLLFAAVGALLFAYFVWRAGPAEVWADISKVGAGFLLVVALAGLRFVVRAVAWTLCFEAPHRLGFRQAFNAYLIGDTAGNILPLGLVVSEPAKAALVRDRVPLVAALSALAVENLFYMFSVALFILSGAAALLLSFPLTRALRWSSVGIICGAALSVVCVALAVHRRWRFLSGVLEGALARGVGRRRLEARREAVASLEARIYGFYERNARRFLPILLLEAAFHLLGVLEAYLTIYLISDVPPTALTAFLFESVNRVITMLFKFIPMRAGVDEIGTGQLARLMSFGEAAGVTLAIIRKGRMMVWMAVGVALLVRRGLTLGGVAAHAGQEVAAEDAETREAAEGWTKDEGWTKG